MYAMAKLIEILHIFDAPFQRFGVPGLIFHFFAHRFRPVVLGYILLGGLTSAIYNEGVAVLSHRRGFLPLVWLGLKNVGAGPVSRRSWLRPTLILGGMGNAHTNPLASSWFGLAMAWALSVVRLLVHGFSSHPAGDAADSMSSARAHP